MQLFSHTVSKVSPRRNLGRYASTHMIGNTSKASSHREGHRPLKDWTDKDIWILSRSDVWDAHAERLHRNVVAVEDCTDIKADMIIKTIHDDAYKHLKRTQMPYYFSMAAIASVCFASLPLTFSAKWVSYFNEHWVTEPLPEHTPETTLEIASWAWTWIEPMSGTFCFLMLCMGLNRSLMKRAGLNPYPNYMMQHRINYIKNKYPQYDDSLLRRYVQKVDRKWEREDEGPVFAECGGAKLPDDTWDSEPLKVEEKTLKKNKPLKVEEKPLKTTEPLKVEEKIAIKAYERKRKRKLQLKNEEMGGAILQEN